MWFPSHFLSIKNVILLRRNSEQSVFARNSDASARKTFMKLLWTGWSTSIPSRSREEPAWGRKGRGVNFPWRRRSLLKGKFTPRPSLPKGDSSLLREGMQDAESRPTQYLNYDFTSARVWIKGKTSSFSQFRPNTKLFFLLQARLPSGQSFLFDCAEVFLKNQFKFNLC